jgi:hypothetical protein
VVSAGKDDPVLGLPGCQWTGLQMTLFLLAAAADVCFLRAVLPVDPHGLCVCVTVQSHSFSDCVCGKCDRHRELLHTRVSWGAETVQTGGVCEAAARRGALARTVPDTPYTLV